MKILINGKELDFTLGDEKNIGQVLAEIESWLSNSGHVISKLSIDDSVISASQIEDAFEMNIDTVKSLEIHTDTRPDLTSSSLLALFEDIKEYESLDYEKKAGFFENWKKSAQAAYICRQMPDLFSLCVKTFLHGEVTLAYLSSVTEERLHELNDPLNEILKIEPLLDDICTRLVDLPLDIQTGKDIKAAQTINLFAAVTDKIFRIYYELSIQGYFVIDNESEKEQMTKLIGEFTNILKELMESFERNDLVLVGDLAEYEASVKIRELYNVIVKNSRSHK
ncbi:MAG: hypothetical protein LBC80_09655 [Treponema sp.]|jgi:hypothetical protein|nr:hypothetical protein [Treponema sp.]